jgi:hypothetical protein
MSQGMRMEEKSETPKSREARYRNLAVEAEERAAKAANQEMREAFLNLANGWHNLAREAGKAR